jgi:hypothetical protein
MVSSRSAIAEAGAHALMRGQASIAVAALATIVFSAALAQDAPADASAPSAWSAEIEASRARHDDWLSCIRAKRFKCDKDLKPSPMDALLNDDTLVAGDIVATPQGLKVFHGQTGAPHRWEDFQ